MKTWMEVYEDILTDKSERFGEQICQIRFPVVFHRQFLVTELFELFKRVWLVVCHVQNMVNAAASEVFEVRRVFLATEVQVRQDFDGYA